MISIIVAIAENYAIGKKGDLLCHMPADLKHFKEITSGQTVLMGERTFFSLPKQLKEEDEAFVIGGGMVYRQMMPLADKLYITHIHHSWEDADTFFPEIDPALWEQTSAERHEADDKNPYAYTFCTYNRRSR